MDRFRIFSITGARPQFIKLAAITRQLYCSELHKKIEHRILHTGQHYDCEMSEIFFQQLKIPRPDYNLGVGSHSPAKQIGLMMSGIEKIFVKEKPDLVIVYGDTNSTLAGAITSVHLGIPVAHVEAGLRSFRMDMPEEINRVLSDRISTLLFCPTKTAVKNLKKEGITENVWMVGDIMYDIFLHAQKYLNNTEILNNYNLSPKNYLLLTIHRKENTDDPRSLIRVLDVLEQSEEKTIFLLHPRTEKFLKGVRQFRFERYRKLMFSKPVGYIDMLILEKNAKKIITDSGGVQKEAFWFNVPCIVLREETEWKELLFWRHFHLVGNNVVRLQNSIKSACRINKQKTWTPGKGNTSLLILEKITRWLCWKSSCTKGLE